MAERRVLKSDTTETNTDTIEFVKNVVEKTTDKEAFKASCLKDVEAAEKRRLHPINLDCIIGHEDLKAELINAIAGKVNADEESKAYLESIDYHAATGIIMSGAPGVGKSNIMRAIAKSLDNHPDIDCVTMDCSEFQGNVGTNAQIINDKFEAARHTKKLLCVMLIDEIDSVMMKKRGHVNVAERTNAMQTNMDGMKDSSKIIIVASTNCPELMEEASLSRFVVINLGLPTLEDRKEMIKKYILPLPMEQPINVDVIAANTIGFTGRNFRDIGRNLNNIRAITKKPISPMVLLKELTKFMSASSRNMNKYAKTDEPNSLNCIVSSIIEEPTYKREQNAVYEVDNCVKVSDGMKSHDVSWEDARLEAFRQKVEESKKTPTSPGVN